MLQAILAQDIIWKLADSETGEYDTNGVWTETVTEETVSCILQRVTRRDFENMAEGVRVLAPTHKVFIFDLSDGEFELADRIDLMEQTRAPRMVDPASGEEFEFIAWDIYVTAVGTPVDHVKCWVKRVKSPLGGGYYTTEGEGS